MGTTKMNLKSFALTVLACLLVALPAIAQVNASGNTLTFSPPSNNLGFTLTVTGPGDFFHTETFDAGAPISWTSKGDDGRYKFELTSIAAPRERGVDVPVKAKPVKITGSALLQGGFFVNADRPENIQKDIVHLDDTIITFSLCVGNDCVNGENFGFDTLRIKENNVRIHFDDTSNSASFPQNDWRIVINDSGNGGANYFGVEDSTAGRIPFRVEAGAPVNTLYAEADGDVGIKTANPVVDLHIVEGNTPTLRLEQDGSDGFTPQTYDIAANESNFFIRDVTNGSKLFFRAKPSAPEDSIFIAANGDIGLGTDAPSQDLHVRDASTSANILVEGTSGSILLKDSDATADLQVAQLVSSSQTASLRGLNDALNSVVNGVAIDLATGNVGIGCPNGADHDLVVSSDATSCVNTPRSWIDAGDPAWSVTSSRTYKDNLQKIGNDGVLDKIADVDVYTYDFIDGPENKLGLMAEDFHTIFGRGSDKSINGQEVQMALWLAVQELTAKVKQLEGALEQAE